MPIVNDIIVIQVKGKSNLDIFASRSYCGTHPPHVKGGSNVPEVPNKFIFTSTMPLNSENYNVSTLFSIKDHPLFSLSINSSLIGY